MKKILFVAIIATLISLVSCTSDEVRESKPEVVTFSIRPESNVKTRAVAPPVAGRDARYIVELWNSDNTSRIDRIVQLNNPNFSLILDRAISYNVAVWVDYTLDVDDVTGTPTDYIFVTSDFGQITLNTVDQDPGAFDQRKYKMSNLPGRDAFTGVFAFTAGQTYPTSLTVKRPFAKINVIATDAEIWKDRQEIDGDTLSFRITNPGYYTYNVLTQTCRATGINVEFQNTVDSAVYNHFPAGTPQLVLSGLYFANANSTDNVLNTPDFIVHWKIGNGPETTVALNDLPFKRNFNTNLTGGTFFNMINFDIDTNTNFDEPDLETGF